ncbi:glutathione S-transferase family protein [Salipiger mangrovisoli]|uniref:Glutathione S-transferase family protein n=1 Tax=Salipiger mangrovisoli TaxID=2865933 RepID=A0ABR9X0B8_9RHOB|nr:glutathione S-transferase family protein [Salipiger mangrovisoli]MBE9636941.1 glutathione S-transferase family protein [Salipiger mangrovisoli]
MTLTLYSHPLASYCHKVLIALYEAGTEFEAVTVDLADPADHARLLELWPVGKLPVLRDAERDVTLAEATIIIDYLDRFHPGAAPMLPDDPDATLQARLWDRVFDLYVQGPMQKIVFDSFRPDAQKDRMGVAAARAELRQSYRLIDRHMASRTWAAGEAFGLADCAAAPALFFAGILEPFGAEAANLSAYFERLLARPSFRQVLVEARPWFDSFPFRHRMDPRFLTMTSD